MKGYDPSAPLLSIHVPKTAGVSFYQVLQGWYGRRLYRHYYYERRHRPPKRRRLRPRFGQRQWIPGVCIHGHFNARRGIGVRDYYPEVDQWVTMLRDPFEVCLSNYFYVKRLGENAFRDGKRMPLAAASIDLGQYLENAKSFLLDFLDCGLTLDNYDDVLRKQFVYIGVAEDLQTSVDTLADHLGFPTTRVPHMNVSPREEPIPDGAREDFMRRHPLEYAVYDFARSNYTEPPERLER